MTLYTQRLCIRKLAPADWPALKEIALDFQHSPLAAYDRPFPTEDEALQKLTTQFAATGLWFAVCLPDSGELIGYVCFHEGTEGMDVGYCFHSRFHHKGYAYESCSALMAELVRRRQAHTFTAGTALNNGPSCRLLQKLGFVLRETEMVSFYKDGAGNDIVFEGGNFVRGVGEAHA